MLPEGGRLRGSSKPEKEPKTRVAWLDTELHKL